MMNDIVNGPAMVFLFDQLRLLPAGSEMRRILELSALFTTWDM
jgi:hypothetical protein